jgi:hypothetical protein
MESVKLDSWDPKVPLPDAAGEGFAMTCSEDEANKLVEDSTMMVTRIIEMVSVNMS